MHLIETYSLATGSKIGKPFIVKKFFPLPSGKYITIQNSSGMPIKSYDHFQQVIDLLLPILQKEGITIAQIGGKEDVPLNGVTHLQGITNINQTAYILDNALLHFGNDSFAVHMANAFGIPTVGLYSITLPEIAGAYFNKDKSISLYPDDGQKPGYSMQESPKRVNKIRPEQVANSCLKLLLGKDDLIKTKTEYVGRRFNEMIIEAVPNQVINPDFFKGATLNLRCDYVDNVDLNIVFNNLYARPCSIITDKGLNISSFIPAIKHNLSLVIYDITKSLDIGFIDMLQFFGVPYVCVFNTQNGYPEELEKRKVDLIEHCGIDEYQLIPSDFDKSILDKDNLTYASNRIILSNGKVYASSSALFNDVPTNGASLVNKITDKERFHIQDLDYCMIFSH